MKKVFGRGGLFTAKALECNARWFVRSSRARPLFSIGPTRRPEQADWVQRSSGLLLELCTECHRQIAPRDVICFLVHFVTRLAILEFAAHLNCLACTIEDHVLPVAAVRIVTSLAFDHHRQ